MRAVLCIGLRNGRQVTPLAPRLIAEDGTVVMAGALRAGVVVAGAQRGGAGVSLLAQRVTYLASVIGHAGLYDCEVCDDETIIPTLTPLTAAPEFVQRVLTQREWQAPATPAPAARSRR